MFAFGPKQTSLVALHMSAIGGKADIDQPLLIDPPPWSVEEQSACFSNG
jgi:hypothetical protein